MGTDEIEEVPADIELVQRVHRNGSLSRRRGRSNYSSIDEEQEAGDYVDVTFEVQGDSIALHVEPVTGNNDRGEDDKLILLGKGMEKKRSFGDSFGRTASNHLRQLSREVIRLTSFSSQVEVEKGKYDRTMSAAFHALKGLKFITKNDGDAGWKKVEDEFDRLIKEKETNDGLLLREKFAECIGMNNDDKSAKFALKLFDAISRRRNIHRDSFNKAQLKDCWNQICDHNFDSRLRIFFDMVDKNADGRIDKEEIEEIIILSASANKLKNIQDQAEEYASSIMEGLDPHGTGFIMVKDLEELLLHGPPTHPVRGESKFLSEILSIKLARNEDNLVKKWYRDTKYFLQHNWKRIWILVLWIGVMSGLFAYKFMQYRRKAAYEVMGHCVCMAKGAAETLKLNMAIILLPVCRNTVTWLRNKSKLGIAVPFDDNLNFHQIIAVAIAIGVGIHSIYHLACDFPSLIHANSEKYELMEPFFGKQATNYWHFVKSWEGVTGIVMVVLMTIAFTLASPWLRKRTVKEPKAPGKDEEPKTPNCLQPLIYITGFNAFWYSHHLFVFVYALLIVHGFKLYFTKEWYKKTTWMYLAIPIIIYALERLHRALKSRIKSVDILKVVVYPANVLALRMSKPQRFRYKSGQYMFVNCADVSPLEWHPFSITSAPGDDYLSVHIRSLGDWTRSLRVKFSEGCSPATIGQSGKLRAECLPGDGSPRTLPKIRIDGPYGAPAQDYKQYEVVLLVGLGIGATPMISITKDILNNIKAKEEEESINNMEEGTVGRSPRASQHKKTDLSNFKTRKAYFYWVTKEQSSFDWFKQVMNEVVEDDHHRGAIELHNYCTNVYEKGDARSVLIAMLQSLDQAKNGVDILTGTPVQSHFGRPNWRSVYKRIACNHEQTRVGVFYCGTPVPLKVLRDLALEFSQKTTTKFDFHKENF